MELKLIFLICLGLLGLFLMGGVLYRLFKLSLKLVLCILVGGILLLLFNTILGQLGLKIAINPVTLLTAGLLQVPGVLLLILLHYFFV
ncbi:pro-sigmaK processing inhibitor BofA family protein [Desulfofundulus thermocisternus]|uniref:pro-sigmaK processing inhibitor BofA family protein n=1 Tax=Desulfofundulus thermocisternus TaxID=42471 RepID=UPI0019FA21F2|nr:pro-sigmaK processing inhibitor BofA family protein [Desulfofundulus thermocisternus]MBE3585969.1 pro-sigmaK processing inhibitor BofA family protein [Thermoanaerobacter sp.]MCS5696875.1 pro-sigmaK processing inhibitor BofA family protein [Desulfofundulus thermocisternus]